MPAANVTVAASFKKTQAQLDKEAVETLKAGIEGGTYRVTEATANTAVAVKTWLINTLNILFGQTHDIQLRAGGGTPIVGDVTITSITPAIAGTAANPQGTNGSFTFTVKLTLGATALTTTNTPGVIVATPYATTKRIELSAFSNLTAIIMNTGNVPTGDLTLTLTGDNADAFTLPATTISSLAVGGEKEITFILKAGLKAGTYKAILTVSGEGLTAVSAVITYTVTPAVANESVGANDYSPLRAWTQNGILHVSGLTAGKPWSIYSISGTLIYRGVATDDVETLHAASLQTHGVYIMKYGSQTVKVLYY
jgi:hypothetical protein